MAAISTLPLALQVVNQIMGAKQGLSPLVGGGQAQGPGPMPLTPREAPQGPGSFTHPESPIMQRAISNQQPDMPPSGFGGGGDISLGPPGMRPRFHGGNERLPPIPQKFQAMPRRLHVLNNSQIPLVTKHYGSGGIAGLQGNSQYQTGGGKVVGPGDGMSDSVDAVIDGQEPAKIASGEFIVPADAVSHLGNGDSEAGHKRLYSMVDNIRKKRTGTTKQPRAVKAGIASLMGLH